MILVDIVDSNATINVNNSNNQLPDFPLEYVTQKCHEIQKSLSIF